jgi:hypothetical protein
VATARELANLARATLIVLGVGVLAGGDTESLPAAVPDLSLAALAAAGAGGVADGRARFRAVYCDVRERHGQGLPDDRPCGEALRQAADEPAPDGRPLPSPSSLPRLRVLVCPASTARARLGWRRRSPTRWRTWGGSGTA